MSSSVSFFLCLKLAVWNKKSIKRIKWNCNYWRFQKWSFKTWNLLSWTQGIHVWSYSVKRKEMFIILMCSCCIKLESRLMQPKCSLVMKRSFSCKNFGLASCVMYSCSAFVLWKTRLKFHNSQRAVWLLGLVFRASFSSVLVCYALQFMLKNWWCIRYVFVLCVS